MNTLPLAVRISAIAGLALLLVSAVLVFSEATTRSHSTGRIDFADYASLAGMWGVCLLAGIAFVWRDRFENPESSDARRSKVSGAIAIAAAIFLAVLSIGIVFYGGLLITQPGETFAVQHFAALPAGLLLASALSLVRALLEFRTK